MSLYSIAQISIILAGIIWGIELIPQLRKTIKFKDVKGVSLSFFTMSFVAYWLYLFGNSILQNWLIVISHIPSFILNSWMILLIIKYKKGDNNDK